MMIAYVEFYILDGVKNAASGANRKVFVCTPLVTFRGYINISRKRSQQKFLRFVGDRVS